MKTKPSHPPTTTKLILTGLITAAAGLALPATSSAQISPNLFTIDGAFTNGVGTGEWSDVTPFAFISAPGVTAIPTSLSNPNRNTLLYASLGRTTPAGEIALFLMYDFLPRTIAQPFQPGELLARVTFPVTLTPNDPTKTNISVLFGGPPPATNAKGAAGGVAGFFDVFVDLDLNGTADVFASSLGITGSLAFGPSTLPGLPHLLAELQVPLRIDRSFGTNGPLNPGGNGINPATGLYDPAPEFWGAAGSANDGTPTFGAAPLQSASGGILGISESGAVNFTPTPEPSTAILLLGSLAMLGARRRRAVSAA